MELLQLPAFADNYLWVLVDDDGKTAVAVDPGDARPVLAALAARGLALAAIWVTHHHPDHVGGIAELVGRWPSAVVVGSASDAAEQRIPHLTHAVHDGEIVRAGGLAAEVLFLPGHTRGLVAYRMRRGARGQAAEDQGGGDLLFSGDCIFGAGCGRLFEGTPAMMQASLARVRALPDATQICAAHEYTRLNLPWAAAVDPDNLALAARIARVADLSPAARTVPLSLAEEKATNPLLRWDNPALRARFGTTNDVNTFKALRASRDTWRRS